MQISNGDVLLRDFTEKDIPNKVLWINDSRNNACLHYDIPLDINKTRSWFLNKDNTVRQDCVIEYQGISVGLVGLLAIDRTNRKAEFYISMGNHEYKHRGIATIATNLILDYAFNTLALNKIYLTVDADNTIACRLYEKTGFKCEGIFRQDLFHRGNLVDRKRYAILREEFRV